MTLYQLASYLVEHYERKAPDGETPLWDDFMATSRERYGVSPFSPEGQNTTVSDKYVADWLELYRMALEGDSEITFIGRGNNCDCELPDATCGCGGVVD